MTTTLGSMRTDVRDRLSESTAREWTDVELNRYINEGLRDVARRSETLMSTSSIPASIGVQQYAMPTDVLRVYRVEWIPASGGRVYPLEYRDFHNMDAVWWTSQTQIQGTVQLFTMWGYPPALNLIVYPIPDQSGNFKVYYYKTPAALTGDAQVSEIPEGWQDIVVNYVEYLALRKDRDPRWQEAKQLYESNLQNMIDMTRRWSDQAGMITEDIPLAPWIWNENY